MTTRRSAVFSEQKRKVCIYVRGDQRVQGVDDSASDLYSHTVKGQLKASEGRLLTGITAEHGATMYQTDTGQAFLYGSIEDNDIYVHPTESGLLERSDSRGTCVRAQETNLVS
jgi:hypothetical protein